MEFFKDRSEIAKGKLQIADGMPEGGLLVVPADLIVNAYLPENQKVVRFGPDEEIFITELIERKDSLTFRANFLEEAIDLPAVSYTHLDVYKRQPEFLKQLCFRNFSHGGKFRHMLE